MTLLASNSFILLRLLNQKLRHRRAGLFGCRFGLEQRGIAISVPILFEFENGWVNQMVSSEHAMEDLLSNKSVHDDGMKKSVLVKVW